MKHPLDAFFNLEIRFQAKTFSIGVLLMNYANLMVGRWVPFPLSQPFDNEVQNEDASLIELVVGKAKRQGERASTQEKVRKREER